MIAAYKKACKETKTVVAKARSDAAKHIYEELDTKEGQAKICKIAKARQRSRQDKHSCNLVKERDGTIFTTPYLSLIHI